MRFQTITPDFTGLIMDFSSDDPLDVFLCFAKRINDLISRTDNFSLYSRADVDPPLTLVLEKVSCCLSDALKWHDGVRKCDTYITRDEHKVTERFTGDPPDSTYSANKLNLTVFALISTLAWTLIILHCTDSSQANTVQRFPVIRREVIVWL